MPPLTVTLVFSKETLTQTDMTIEEPTHHMDHAAKTTAKTTEDGIAIVIATKTATETMHVLDHSSAAFSPRHQIGNCCTIGTTRRLS